MPAEYGSRVIPRWIPLVGLLLVAACSGGGGGSSDTTSGIGDVGDACTLVADLTAIGNDLAAMDLADPSSSQALADARADIAATLDDLAEVAPPDIKRDVVSMAQAIDDGDLATATQLRSTIDDYRDTSCTD
jgi:hypothetical protein